MEIRFHAEGGEWIPFAPCEVCGGAVALEGESTGHVLWTPEDPRAVTVHKGNCHRQAERRLKEGGQMPLWIPLADAMSYLRRQWRHMA